jgi:regulator of protease activity HflC (stomatin/prohibitin superfamily)
MTAFDADREELPRDRAGWVHRWMETFKNHLGLVAGFVLLVLVLYGGLWEWILCRVYVSPGGMLVLSAKFGDENSNPDEMRVVPDGVKGIRERVLGEGRHFYNPFTYDRITEHHVVEIPEEFIGLVESKSGKPLPPGEFLAEQGYKGVMRKVLTPGKWRLNPVAFHVTLLPATVIKPGYVGCVTSLSGKPSSTGTLARKGEKGIQQDILQAGIYYLNPREYQVDVVGAGYRHISFAGVEFPSRDGFSIKLDISVVWGLEPASVPIVVHTFGNVDDVVKKIIFPQVESICRIQGSRYGAKEFIEGKTREEFQDAFTRELEAVCKSRNIDVLLGLVRAINVPTEVRTPIQEGKIAVEEKLTKEEQKTTQTVKNDLEELKADVQKGVREVEAETTKMLAEVAANGESEVAKIEAETQVQAAAIQLEAARLDALKTRLLGKAKADVEELLQTARSDELAQSIAALGTPEDYARYVFATNLPPELKVFLRYAGPGTLWTDLPEIAKNAEKLAALKILEDKAREQGK